MISVASCYLVLRLYAKYDAKNDKTQFKNMIDFLKIMSN